MSHGFSKFLGQTVYDIAHFRLRVLHNFREENCLTDAFANFGGMNSSFTWQDLET